MTSNCSLYRLRPLDPSIDPAYQDGPPPHPHPHPPRHAGEISLAFPVSTIPWQLSRFQTVSIEVLEDEIEREAQREERSPG